MDPNKLTQEAKQYLWEKAGHSGKAPVGYGGENRGYRTPVMVPEWIEYDQKFPNHPPFSKPDGSDSDFGALVKNQGDTEHREALQKLMDEWRAINPDPTPPSTETPTTPTTPVEPPLTPTQKLINTAVDAYTKQVDDYKTKYGEFEANNPFVFDKVLEEEKIKVKQRLDPYYEQTLSDFLQGVNTKRRRSLEDERTLLTELNQDTDRVVGNQRMQLDDALQKSKQGFADAGIYDSGKRIREEGRLEASTNENMATAFQAQQRGTQRIETGAQRTAQDLTLQESTKRRDLTQEQSFQTESQALPEVERLRTQREFERGQYTGAPAGVPPLDFNNSLYQYLA